MPKVTQQSPRPSTPATDRRGAVNGASVLDRIVDVRPGKVGRLKVSVYGQPKTGKTRLACTFPKPLLIAGFEDGTESVVGVPNVKFVHLLATDELTTLVEGPIAAGRWKTVVVDTATKMRDMRCEELFRASGVKPPPKKPFLYADAAWKEVWQQSAADLKRLLGQLLDSVRTVDLNVVVVAQEQVFGAPDENPSAVPLGEAIRPAVGSALGKQLCIWLNAECDYIGQAFIRQQTKEVKADWEGVEGGVTQVVATGRKEFCLRVGPHENYITGFRQHVGAPELPDVIVNPTYAKIEALIRGK